jgi:hypothetical protein
MAVPASGQLTLGKIYRELIYDDYNSSNSVSGVNASLKNMSTGVTETLNTSSASIPDGIAPHKMSEWYGYDHDVSTATAPTVTTGICSWNSTNNKISAVGSVSSDGGSTITERGFCHGTFNPPTTSSAKTIVSGTTGAMSASITVPMGPSSYNIYVRAYAINSIGTGYGVTRTVTVPGTGGGGKGGPGGGGEP